MGTKRAAYKFLSIVLLLFGMHAGVVAACTEMDAQISALLKDKKYEEAEKIALEKIAADPGSKNANLNLAYVYFNRALSPVMGVNTRAMGLGDGETGSVELKDGDYEKYFYTEIQHNPEYGTKVENKLKDIIQKWPSDKTAYWCMMNYYQQAKRHDDLLDFVPKVVLAFKSLGYELVDELLPYAARYIKDKKFSLAASFYKELLTLFPKSAPVTSSYGVATLSMGDLDGGLALFLKAYDLDKKDPIILSNVSEAYIYKQQFEQASKYLHLLLGVKPEKTETYFRLATLDMSSGPAASKKAWEKYLQQHEKYPDHEYWVDLARKVLEGIDQGIADADLLSLAGNFSRSNVPFYAVPVLAYLLEKDPDNLYHSFLFAQAYEVAGFPLKSYEYVKNAVEIANNTKSMGKKDVAGINYEAGRVAYSVGEFEEALQYFKVTEKYDKDRQNIQYMLGMTRHQLGHEKAAIKKYQKCIKMENNKDYVGYCKSNLKKLQAKK